jgi:hypothetical protein
MKVTLKRLSACPCGFPALHEDIQLGKEYDIDPNVKLPLTLICGGCGKHNPVMGVHVEPAGFLPEVLFADPEQKMMKLTDILTSEQLDMVESILSETPDQMDATRKLRKYFATFKEDLLAKGVVSEYLAYVIAYKQWTGGDNGDRVVAFST